jgi:hypothetical protein
MIRKVFPKILQKKKKKKKKNIEGFKPTKNE